MKCKHEDLICKYWKGWTITCTKCNAVWGADWYPFKDHIPQDSRNEQHFMVTRLK